ncbi:MAG: thioesterase, partial [bacterium]|nr:thioesterase [bacterium]
IEEMTGALLDAVAPLLDRPFAFFGHSMGATIGFELARALRRSGQQMPVALFCAAARAPQFRKDHVPGPEPSEEEFLAEIRRLEGVPKDILDHEELLRFLLPALRADSTLGRIYVYAEEPPLDCPIFAYVGSEDPRLGPEVIEPWREQTTTSFAMRTLPGGHFFLHTAMEDFLGRLTQDISSVTE